MKAGGFPIAIYSWDDIQAELGKKSNLDICRRFYGDFFINYEQLGIAISRIVRVAIGVGATPDTQYELSIGKTASAGDQHSCTGLNYWKGTYFIGNWTEKRLDTFRLPVFASDLEHAFQFKRDAHIIATWLTRMRLLDDLIDGKDEEEHVMLLSEAEYQEYMDLTGD